MTFTLSIPPGPGLHIDVHGDGERDARERLLDELQPHLERALQAVPGSSLSRQIRDRRISIYVGDYAARDVLVERVRRWLVAKGYEVAVTPWVTS